MRHEFNTQILQETTHRPWAMPDRPWVMTQTWHDLLFAHWPLPPERLRLPAPFDLDLFQDLPTFHQFLHLVVIVIQWAVYVQMLNVFANDLTLVDRLQVQHFVPEDIEMIRPELDHAFVQLPL